MDAPRQLGPPRQIDNSGGQLNSVNGVQQQVNASLQNNYPLHHSAQQQQQHMQQLNGPRHPNMTVSQQQPGTLTIQGPNTLQPGTVYLIRSPSGELQLVRLAATPNAPHGPGNVQQQRPGLPQSNPQMPQSVRFPAPGNLSGPHGPHQHQQHPNLSQGSIMGNQGPISVPSGLGQGPLQQHSHPHMVNHIGNAGAGHLQMPIQQRPPMQPPPPQPNKIEDPLNKAKQFFNALLSMSKNQTPAMYATARDLLQQLVDGKINPDIFAQRLQEELKSTPQPILAPLLKACLSKLREGLINGEIVIDGISPPPASVLSLPDPSTHTTGMHPPAHPPHLMGLNNIQHSPDPPKPVPQPAPPKPKGGKNALKAAAVATAAAAAANASLSELHPVFGQLPQLQTHQKTEKAKITKPPAEKKLTAKQKKEQQLKDRRSLLEAQTASHLPVSSLPKEQKEQKESKPDEDELNDVAAMGGVNLTEESAKLATADIVGTQTRSIEDHSLISIDLMRRRVTTATKTLVHEDIPTEVLTLLSHAVEARIRNCCERLNVITEHRSESVRGHVHYKPTQDVKQQLKYIEEMDKVEKRKRDEEEKEALLRAAKSRNRPEDPDHMLKKLKAKELQRVEQEELRTREANQAALAALSQVNRKRPRPDGGPEGITTGPTASGINKLDGVKSQPFRPRIKRVCLRDVIFMAETDGKMSKSAVLYGLLHQVK